MRAASSKGAADLIALWPHRGSCGTFRDVPDVWLVQCKTDGKLPLRERKALWEIAGKTGATAVLARRHNRKLQFVRLGESLKLDAELNR